MFFDAVIRRDTQQVVFNATVIDTCRFVLHMNPKEDDKVYIASGASLQTYTPLEYLKFHGLSRDKLFTLNDVIEGLKVGRSFKREFDDGGFEMVRSLGDGHRFEHTVVGIGSGGLAELDISIIDEQRWGMKLWEEMQ